jgi:hypothetical protein
MYLVYNTVVRLCQFFCCGGKVNVLQSWSFLKNIENFLCKKMIPCKTQVQEDQLFLALYGSTTIQSLLFLKNIKNFVWFPKQYSLGFFLLEKQLANISDGVSCFSVTLFYSTLFCCGRKANLVRFTLYYSTLLTFTDGQNDRQRNEYTRFAWAGGTFFTVVLLFQFLVLAGNRFWFYIFMYLEYNTVVVLC